MKTRLLLGTVSALIVSLAAVAALASPAKLNRPVSVQEGRLSALQAAKVKNIWVSGHHVTLLGFSGSKSVVMVKSPDLDKPALVTLDAAKGKYGRQVRATALTAKGMKALGLITPTKAMETALLSGGIFGKVKGETKYAGASNKGFAYKFTVTPAKPVKVESPYGTYTIEQLTRVVNAMGNGESAYPTPGKYKWNYQPK